jgi:hypothetical protein
VIFNIYRKKSIEPFRRYRVPYYWQFWPLVCTRISKKQSEVISKNLFKLLNSLFECFHGILYVNELELILASLCPAISNIKPTFITMNRSYITTSTICQSLQRVTMRDGQK